MKYRTLLLLLCAAILCCGVVPELWTSPVLLWSSRNTFSARNLQHNHFTAADQITSALFHSQATEVSPYLSSEAATPEVLVVYIEPQMSTDQFSMLSGSHRTHPDGGAFHSLKNLMESVSVSSLVLPYTYTEEGERTLFEELILSANGQVLLAQKPCRGTEERCAEFLEEMKITQAHESDTLEGLLKRAEDPLWEIYNNKKMDIIVVNFRTAQEATEEDFADSDKYIARLNLALKDVNHVSILTTDKPQSIIRTTMPDSHPLLARFEQRYEQENLGETLWPGGVVQALIVMIPFFFILILGLCCTMQVQSGLDFELMSERKRQ